VPVSGNGFPRFFAVRRQTMRLALPDPVQRLVQDSNSPTSRGSALPLAVTKPLQGFTAGSMTVYRGGSPENTCGKGQRSEDSGRFSGQRQQTAAIGRYLKRCSHAARTRFATTPPPSA